MNLSATIKFWTTSFCMALAALPVMAQNPKAVATFHCLSWYWSPKEGATAKKVTVQYREANRATWRTAHEGVYNRVMDTLTPTVGDVASGHDYRGSIVNLNPNTKYQVRLTLDGSSEEVWLTAQTINEIFPIDEKSFQIVALAAARSTSLNISEGGNALAYKVYDGRGFTLDLKSNVINGRHAINIAADYVVVRNFNIANAPQHAINIVGQHHHIVIEDCSITGWGDAIGSTDSITFKNIRQQDPRTGFAKGRSAIFNSDVPAGQTGAHHLVVQRNTITAPQHNATHWNQFAAAAQPAGTNGISLNNAGEANVIRYNYIAGTPDRMLNNGITGEGGNGYRGSPGGDADIYGNHIANCYDDGIEAEGGQVNVRIWSNYIDNTHYPLGLAPVSLGPVWVWRNVFGRVGLFGLKFGDYGGSRLQTGHVYVYNNTFLQPSQDGGAGFGVFNKGGSTNGKGRLIRWVTARNNILRQRNGATSTYSTLDSNTGNSYDYNLTSTGQTFVRDNGVEQAVETHGIRNAVALYEAASSTAHDPTPVNGVGNFRLKKGTPGYDAGVVIANFCDNFKNKAPDMGAQEGAVPMAFGVAAIFLPYQHTTTYNLKTRKP